MSTLEKLAKLKLKVRLSHAFKLIVLTSIIFSNQKAYGQNCFTKSFIKKEFFDVYIAFFNQVEYISRNDQIDSRKFQALFTNNPDIQNDIIPLYEEDTDEWFTSVERYLHEIETTRTASYTSIQSDVESNGKVMFGSTGGLYFFWFRVKFEIYIKGELSTTKNFIKKVTFISDHRSNVLRVTKMSNEKAFPTDLDNDEIADEYDQCIKGKNRIVNIVGCDDNDSDCDGIPNNEDRCPNLKGVLCGFGCPDADCDGVSDGNDRCPTIKGPKSNSGCPNPPFTRIDLGFGLNGLYPQWASFSEKDILNENDSLKNAPGFAKLGFGGTAELDFHIKRWLGLIIAYNFSYIMFDKESLRNQLKIYLRSNNLYLNDLTVEQKGYKFHSVGAGLRFGNHEAKKVSFSLVPFAYYFVTGISTNSLKIDVAYTNLSPESNVIDLNPESFFVFGGRVTFNFRLSDDDKIRLFVGANYIQGTIPFNDKKLPFKNLPTPLYFPDMTMKSLMLNLGLKFSLTEPKYYKKW